MPLRSVIRAIPDHPKPGILFYDLTPLFADAAALGECVTRMRDWARPLEVDLVLGAESRGFIAGGALAHALGAGFVTARKAGRLPGETVRHDYDLEYGTDALEVHTGAIRPGQRVLVHDDLLATGGTAEAAVRLAESQGGVVVGATFIVELTFLPGRRRLGALPIQSLVSYDTEAVTA
ncbi:MAG: adenine phosphoribosyltransferase [Thermoleophilia bacterium]